MLLLLRLFRTNGTMKYYKDIAAFLKISVSRFNTDSYCQRGNLLAR